MSIKDNIHFPDYVDLDEFYEDYINKVSNARELQRKYNISPRQYRLIVRYFRDKYKTFKKYEPSMTKYIYITREGKYSIRKRTNGRFRYFGTYKDLDKAMSVRDKLVECNWDKRMVKIWQSPNVKLMKYH